MNPLNEIRARLEDYPNLELSEIGNGLTVSTGCDEGFDVWFVDDGNEYTVGFDGWHQHFSKLEVKEALNCFAFGLSDKCRLRVVSRGSKKYKWTMEAQEEGDWVAYSTTALLLVPFWRKKVINYRSNNILGSSNA